MADRGTYEDLQAHVDALANSVNKYRVEVAELDLLYRAQGVALSEALARIDKLEDARDTGVLDLDLDGDAL